MAQRTQVVLIDDLDGKEVTDGGQTVSFSLNGKTWEIDLGEKNAKKLQDALAPFMAAGRRAGGGRRGRSASSSSHEVDTKAVRAWAASNGIELSSRGRIPASVIERYKAAGN